ncbi:hypothetical protein BGW38_005870, partial [Lunasporangiospora selenospora]
NVYLYCSREGVPDSVKNNKEIKRKRLSMRCDCKWRITLFQQESKQWVFRKAMNPASMIHNHPLISPDDIRQPWPSTVFDRIAYYANQRNLTTSETRERIKEDFPDLIWDERRFYNRLTEERKQIRLRDSESRVFSTMDLAARVASLASADPTLSYKVTSSLENVLVEICEQLRIDPAGAGQRVMTSPPSSAGGGGPSGGLGTMMSMTSPTSASSGFSSSSSSSPLSSADYVVTYPGCVISVKSTPNQKGRPSSVSSPVADSYGLGLGMSALNDRKRSLSEECFTRHGLPGSSTGAPSFGSAMNASQMMSHLDISANGPLAPLQGSLPGLDSSVIPGGPGLLMMQSNYHTTPTGGHAQHSSPTSQHPPTHHTHLQYSPQVQPQQQPNHHHLSSGMATSFRPTPVSQPQQSHYHISHHPPHPHSQGTPLGTGEISSADLSLEVESPETSGMLPPKRAHSVEIKQEIQSIYQPLLSGSITSHPTQQPSAPMHHQRRSGSSPGTSGNAATAARLYSHPYQLSSAAHAVQSPPPPPQQTLPSGFHQNQLLGDTDDVFNTPVSFSTTAGHYHYASSGNYLPSAYATQADSSAAAAAAASMGGSALASVSHPNQHQQQHHGPHDR